MSNRQIALDVQQFMNEQLPKILATTALQVMQEGLERHLLLEGYDMEQVNAAVDRASQMFQMAQAKNGGQRKFTGAAGKIAPPVPSKIYRTTHTADGKEINTEISNKPSLSLVVVEHDAGDTLDQPLTADGGDKKWWDLQLTYEDKYLTKPPETRPKLELVEEPENSVLCQLPGCFRVARPGFFSCEIHK